MKKWILTIIFSVASILSYGEYSYDYQTGNSYNTTQEGDGVNVQGYNANTGSSWNTTIENNGNQHGTDSRGNYWSYDSNSGYYQNSDGHSCIGKGVARSCN